MAKRTQPQAEVPTESLSDFGKQLAVLLEIAGPWQGEGSPTFTDLLAQALGKFKDQAAALATARGELAEQEREKLLLIQELAGFKKEVAEDLGFLYESCGCISDSDMMDEVAASANRLGLQLISPAETAPAPLQEGEAAEPVLTQASTNNLARLDYWRYQPGTEKPQVDGRGWAFPDNPSNPTGWNVYIGPALEYIGKQGLLCVGEIKQGQPSFFSLDDDEREIIGTYEISGLPVYEGDDYVTDAEGCYLTREEADELAQEADNESPPPPLEGKAAGPTYEDYLAAAEKSKMPSPIAQDIWEGYSQEGRHAWLKYAQDWTQPVDAEGKPLAFHRGQHKTE